MYTKYALSRHLYVMYQVQGSFCCVKNLSKGYVFCNTLAWFRVEVFEESDSPF